MVSNELSYQDRNDNIKGYINDNYQKTSNQHLYRDHEEHEFAIGKPVTLKNSARNNNNNVSRESYHNDENHYTTSQNSGRNIGGGCSNNIAAALMGHGQTDYSFRDKNKDKDYNTQNKNIRTQHSNQLDYNSNQYQTSSVITQKQQQQQQQYVPQLSKGNSSRSTANMGGLSLYQHQQQEPDCDDHQSNPKYSNRNGYNSSNAASALSGNDNTTTTVVYILVNTVKY